MNYWPLSVIRSSPLTPPEHAWELSRVYETMFLTEAAFRACAVIAQQTKPMKSPNLVIIESVNAPARRAYSGYPDTEEWLRLERGGVVEGSNGMLHVIIDALH